MTKRNKQLREIYLLAAEMTEEANYTLYACNSIDRAARELFNQFTPCEARELFHWLYNPNNGSTVFWVDFDQTRTEQRENRILALLFMAELARTDSLPTLEEIQPK